MLIKQGNDMNFKTMNKSRIYLSLTVAIFVIGFALRLRQYLFCRCLWLDEAMLALNILGRDYGEFFYPETYATKMNEFVQFQVAGTLCLWVFKKQLFGWLAIPRVF